MKKYFILVLAFLTSFFTSAQDTPTDTTEIESKFKDEREDRYVQFDEQLIKLEEAHNAQIMELKSELNLVESKFTDINDRLESLKIRFGTVNSKLDQLTIIFTSLDDEVKNELFSVNKLSDSLGIITTSLTKDLGAVNKTVDVVESTSDSNAANIQSINKSLTQKQQYAIMLVAFSIVLILVIYIILSRRQANENKILAAKQKEIFEKQVQDGQQLTDWLSEQSLEKLDASKDKVTDHSFAIRVADEIVRITTNLSRMDESIKGYKQLSASARKLEQSLNSNNYEIEDLLNKAYNNGMNLQAHFVTDENLKDDESIITRIIKPQINFKGKLIQAAEVEVSQR